MGWINLNFHSTPPSEQHDTPPSRILISIATFHHHLGSHLLSTMPKIGPKRILVLNLRRRTPSARQRILELGDPEGALAPIYHGILKHLGSVSDIINVLQASRPANEYWKVDNMKNAAAVLWPLFLEKIPYFQEVIVAVCPTSPVCQLNSSSGLFGSARPFRC